MPRYSAEIREQALKSMAEVGVAQTAKDMHIGAQTLYKWRRAQAEPDTPVSGAEVQSALDEDACADERLAQLEAENAQLTQMLADEKASHAAQAEKYRAQIAKLKKVIASLLEE